MGYKQIDYGGCIGIIVHITFLRLSAAYENSRDNNVMTNTILHACLEAGSKGN